MMSLMLLLAVGSAIPGLNVIALGYMLDVEGRIATGQRPRLPAAEVAPLLAKVLLQLLLLCALLRGLSNAARDARLIDPSAGAGWWITTGGVAIVGALWLLRKRRQVAGAVERLDLRRYLRLGLLGLLVAMLWLGLPAALLALARGVEKGGLFALMGVVLLLPVLMRLPFLQARLAETGDLRAGLDWRHASALLRRAPVSSTLAIALAYLITTPLYLFAAVELPPDALWLVGLLFVPTILLARAVIALAYRRAQRLETEAGRLLRWTCRPVLGAVVTAYGLVLFFAPQLAVRGSLMTLLPPAFTVLL